MLNGSGFSFDLSPFISGVWRRFDAEKRDVEGQMTGRRRPGVSSYSRFFFIYQPLGCNDVMNKMNILDWLFSQCW